MNEEEEKKMTLGQPDFETKAIEEVDEPAVQLQEYQDDNFLQPRKSNNNARNSANGGSKSSQSRLSMVDRINLMQKHGPSFNSQGAAPESVGGNDGGYVQSSMNK